MAELVGELRAAVARHYRAGRWAASSEPSPRLLPAAFEREPAQLEGAPAAAGAGQVASSSPDVGDARDAPRGAAPAPAAPPAGSSPPGPSSVSPSSPGSSSGHASRSEAVPAPRAASSGPRDPELARFDDVPLDEPPPELDGDGDFGGMASMGLDDLGPPMGRAPASTGAAGASGGADRGGRPARAAAPGRNSGYAARPAQPPAASAAPAPTLPLPMAPPTRSLAVDEGEPLLRGKKTLATIRADLGDCQRCKLAKSRNKIVFGAGADDAALVFVGEAPGADEDRTGEPFVGRAGELLDKMIEAMGWSRGSVYIANLLKCRPPNNRNPEPDEAAACRPFLVSQLEVLAPRIIVALGRPSANALLSVDAPIGSLRGKFHERMGLKIMPTFHPAYLLREPNRKRDAWADLQLVMTELTRIGVTPRR